MGSAHGHLIPLVYPQGNLNQHVHPQGNLNPLFYLQGNLNPLFYPQGNLNPLFNPQGNFNQLFYPQGNLNPLFYPLGQLISSNINPHPVVIPVQSEPDQDCCSTLGCSIFNTLLCFFWLGIPAIIFSVKARESFQKGLFNDAKRYAYYVKIFNIIGIIIGSVVVAAISIYLIVYYTTTTTPLSVLNYLKG